MMRSSPHLPVRASVSRVMLLVIAALVPGVLAYVWTFGWGVLVNLAVAITTALAAEAALLRWRGRPLLRHLRDGSAIVTAMLLALAIPAYAPWWLPMLGVAFAMAFGKHLYGGLGYNPFNPAMLGYVILLISFPTEMSSWVAPHAHAPELAAYVGGAGTGALDGLTAATPLDHVKTELIRQLTVGEAQASMRAGFIAGYGWDLINLCLLLGGIGLLWLGVIRWQIPVGMLAGLAVMTLLFALVDSDRHPGLLHHWFGGATMMGAFFIATDPVTASTTPRGRLVYGLGIGVLIYLIRSFGGYPDAVAFSVLLMNICVPLIDQFTPPKIYGASR